MPPPSAEPRLSPQERRRRREERPAALRLRMAIGRELDERGIAEPAAVGAALGLPAAEATKLLNRHRWREGDVALLTAAAARTVRAGTPGGGSGPPPQRGPGSGGPSPPVPAPGGPAPPRPAPASPPPE